MLAPAADIAKIRERPMPLQSSPAPQVHCEVGLESIVQAARSGDRAAFARLHDRFAPMVHGIALARLPAHDAQDIVQEVFLHALCRLRTLRELESVGPWLARITRNLASEFYRTHKRVEPLHEMVETRIEIASQENEAERILKAIRELPEAYAETLALRLVEGLSGPQIAACTGLTPGSVRVNLHRGMQLLRQKLGPKDELERES